MLHIVDGEAKWVSHGRCLGFFYSLHILQSSMCTHKTYPTNFHGLRENLSYCKSANNPKMDSTTNQLLRYKYYKRMAIKQHSKILMYKQLSDYN